MGNLRVDLTPAGAYVRWTCTGHHPVPKLHVCGMPCSFGPVTLESATKIREQWEAEGTPECYICQWDAARDYGAPPPPEPEVPDYHNPPLYKTVVVVWSEKEPCPSMSLEDIGREADQGCYYCSKISGALVTKPETDPDWDGTEFFLEDS